MISSPKINLPDSLQLLGIGSAKDRALKRNLQDALAQLSLDVPIQEVRDIERLLDYGISGIPALLVNGKVIFQKVVPSVEDIRIVLNVLLQPGESQNHNIKNILVPTDFSEAAEHAFEYACELAAILQAKVHLVHIHQPAVDMGGVSMIRQSPELVQDKEGRLQEWIKERHKLSTGARRVDVSTELKVGFVSEELKRMSEKPTDLMVMGMTGNNHLLDKWLGTTATEMSRKAKCPVLLVPQHSVFRVPHDIVYASAYAPGEEKLLPEILGFASQFDATLHFVHIEEVKNKPTYEVHQVPVSLSRENQNVRMHFSTVNSDDVLSGLQRYSDDHQSDILVMTTPRRKVMEELFHRSTTRKMIFQAQSPLLIMHYEKD